MTQPTQDTSNSAMVDGVHMSSIGQLFLTGGEHNVHDYFSGTSAPTAASVVAFGDNHRARTRYCAERGIAFSTWVFPDKLFALRETVPELGPLGSLFQTHYAATAPEVVYPIECLEGQGRCFTLGDTHYSLRGEIEVMTRIFNHIEAGFGARYRLEAVPAMTGRRRTAGDLAKKLTPPLREKIKTMEPLRPHTQTLNGIAGNNGAIALLESLEAETDQTLLIFGDSFFRVMLQHLTYRFRRIVFCRTPFFHREIVPAVGPDVILCGSAERYLAHCLPDAERPHLLAYAMQSGKTLAPQDGFAQMFQTFFDREKLLSGKE